MVIPRLGKRELMCQRGSEMLPPLPPLGSFRRISPGVEAQRRLLGAGCQWLGEC